MPGTYSIEKTATGHIRIADHNGRVGLYAPDGTHKTGHKFGWFTVWVLIRDFKLNSQTHIRLV